MNSKITRLIKRLLSPDDALIAKYFLNDKGELKFENPTVQLAILNLIRDDLIARAKELEAEKKKKGKK